MAAETIYGVTVDYTVRDKARGTEALSRQLGIAGQKANFLSSTMGRVAAAGAGLFGARAAAQAFIGFNDSMEQARITMAGVMSNASGRDFNATMKDSVALVGQLQQRAKVSLGTTKDMVNMASMLAGPLTRAGMGMKDLENFSVAAVGASKAFGVEADVAARDIEGALAGQYNIRDRYTKNILESKMFGGQYTGEEGRARYNALSASKRASELNRGQMAPGISDMMKAQGKSFSGVMSTFKDNLEMTLGTVGLPLFQRITDELKNWNAWIDKNGDKLAVWGKEFSGYLIEGFKMAKGIAGFIIEHKDLLMSLAKAWLIGKGVSGITTGILGPFVAMANAAQAAAGMSGLGGFVTKLGGASMALAAVAAGAVALAEWVDNSHEDRIDADVSRKAFEKRIHDVQTGGTQASTLYKQMKADGMLDGSGKVQRGKLPLDWHEKDGYGDTSHFNIGEEVNGVQQMMYDWALQELVDRGASDVAYAAGQAFRDMELQAPQVAESFKDAFAKLSFDDLMSGLGSQVGVPDALKRNLDFANPEDAAKPPKINVTIQRIEVQTDDPDRFVFNLGETVQRAARQGGMRRGGPSRG